MGVLENISRSNQMNEKQLIGQIMDLFAEIDRQQREIEGYRRDVASFQQHDGTSLSDIDRRALKTGREKIYTDSVRCWKEYDGGMDFEEWRTRKIHRIPNYMSRDDFYSYFDSMLREGYEREKAEYESEKREGTEDE